MPSHHSAHAELREARMALRAASEVRCPYCTERFDNAREQARHIIEKHPAVASHGEKRSAG